MTQEASEHSAIGIAETTPFPFSWEHHHLPDTIALSPTDIQTVFDAADYLKRLHEQELPFPQLLQGETFANLFVESSTRTRVSFELAAKNLGATVVNMTSSGSSLEKGETLPDTAKTLQALGATMIALRHKMSGAPYTLLNHMQSPPAIINAGDGWHAHPTQALLDVYTMRDHLGDLTGKRVVIVGDITHSRVARSNFDVLTKLGAQVIVSGPPTLMPPALEAQGVIYHHSLAEALKDADVVMALRLQKERMASGLLPSEREYRQAWGVTQEILARYPNILVMHPGPTNEGVEIDAEVARSPQSLIEEQVANGIFIRMAILALIHQARHATIAKADE